MYTNSLSLLSQKTAAFNMSREWLSFDGVLCSHINAEGKILKKHPYRYEAHRATISPDDQLVATSCTRSAHLDSSGVRIHTTDQLNVIDNFEIPSSIQAMCFHPQWPLLAMGDARGNLSCRAFSKKDNFYQEKLKIGGLAHLSFSSCGTYICALSDVGYLSVGRFYGPQSVVTDIGSQRRRTDNAFAGVRPRFSNSGNLLIYADNDGNVVLEDVERQHARPLQSKVKLLSELRFVNNDKEIASIGRYGMSFMDLDGIQTRKDMEFSELIMDVNSRGTSVLSGRPGLLKGMSSVNYIPQKMTEMDF